MSDVMRGGTRLESVAQLETVLREVADGITVQAPDGTLLYANEAAARQMGLASAELLLAMPVPELMERFDLLSEGGGPFPLDRLPGRRALLGEAHAEEMVGWRVRATGEEHWSIVRATPVFEDDRVSFAISVFQDVTDRKRAEDALRLLAEAGELLGESLDYARTLRRLAEIAVPRLADWCMVYTVASDGSIERLAVQHARGLHTNVLAELSNYEFDLDASTGVPFVIRTGEPILEPDATSAMVAADVHGADELARDLDSLGICSWMCVPLRARGRTLGALSLLAAESARRFGEPELGLAVDLARRAALAIDNARLYEEARTSARDSIENFTLLESLLASAPVGVGFWDTALRYVRVNDALAAINGMPAEEHVGRTLGEVVPGLADQLEPVYRRVLETGEPYVHLEMTGEAPTEPGEERHWLSSYYPVRDADAGIVGMGAVISEITERKRAELALQASEARLSFLAEASRILASSLDYETTLQNVVELSVPRLADWSSVYLLDQREVLQQVAVAHRDPERTRLVRELWERWGRPPGQEPVVARVVRTREPMLADVTDEFLTETARDEDHLERMRELGARSGIVVPLIVGGRALGGITFTRSAAAGPYDEADLALAEELARRAAIAIDNARLFREAEERAQAAQALTFVADGVALLDRRGIVRLWNPAAEAITGLRQEDVVGRAADVAVPGWPGLIAAVPIASSSEEHAAVETLPLELDGRELWLSISGVDFEDGTVFAFRDVTAERNVEQLKSDFVSTISHELRTPLAAIYGAAVTLRRSDLRLAEEQRGQLLGVVANEADRLARIVNDILWASRVESGTLSVTIENCDPAQLARDVVEAQGAHLPDGISLSLAVPDGLPLVAADPDKVRQVLVNLLDNAVKYSPDGGEVELALAAANGRLRFAVRDEGLGIPSSEHVHVFEKFYRLDPDLTRGVGGTGLGLYISRELVRRMAGRIELESEPGEGSTFTVDLPFAER